MGCISITNRIKNQTIKFYSDKENINKRLNIDLTFNQARQLMAEQNNIIAQNSISSLVNGQVNKIYFLNISLGLVKTIEVSQGLIE